MQHDTLYWRRKEEAASDWSLCTKLKLTELTYELDPSLKTGINKIKRSFYTMVWHFTIFKRDFNCLQRLVVLWSVFTKNSLTGTHSSFSRTTVWCRVFVQSKQKLLVLMQLIITSIKEIKRWWNHLWKKLVEGNNFTINYQICSFHTFLASTGAWEHGLWMHFWIQKKM